MVSNVQELHKVGTFCNIVELQDLGDKLRMIVMAHRRIRLIGQVVLEEEVEISPLPSADDSVKKRRFRRRAKKDSENNPAEEVKTEATETSIDEGISVSDVETDATKVDGTEKAKEDPFTPVPVLMIEAENVKPSKPVMTTEVKVGCLVVLKYELVI